MSEKVTITSVVRGPVCREKVTTTRVSSKRQV